MIARGALQLRRPAALPLSPRFDGRGRSSICGGSSDRSGPAAPPASKYRDSPQRRPLQALTVETRLRRTPAGRLIAWSTARHAARTSRARAADLGGHYDTTLMRNSACRGQRRGSARHSCSKSRAPLNGRAKPPIELFSRRREAFVDWHLPIAQTNLRQPALRRGAQESRPVKDVGHSSLDIRRPGPRMLREQNRRRGDPNRVWPARRL